MKKTKRIRQTIAVAVALTVPAALVACTAPGETVVTEQEGYADYTETRVGKYIHEMRFTDTDGIRWKCFAMQAGYAGGLDGCEKVG